MPMSAHALKERGQGVPNIPSLLEDDPASIVEPPRGSPFGPPGIMPMDTLPEQAKQDPTFREGAGSMYAINQPHLAMKYGVVRQGNLIPPQVLSPVKDAGRPRASDKTIKGLEDVVKFQHMREKAESGDLRPEQEAEKGSAAAAAKIGNAPGDNSPKPLSEEERKRLSESTVMKMDDFDFDTFRQMMMKDLLNNEDQKKIIEERVKPLDLADLIATNHVKQDVPIVPSKFWVTFRSVAGNHDLAVKRLLMEEAKSVEVNERYYLDKFAFMTLTLGIFAINGNPLPDYLDDKGHFDEEKFWRKYEYVSNLNYHMLASLGVNYFWFDIRVRRLFVAEKLKNG
jgi:hypothetical protein